MAKGDIETYHEDGQWKNRAQGNTRASNTFDRKADAQAAGRAMAKDRGVEHVIKRQNGTIHPPSRDPRKRGAGDHIGPPAV